MCKSLKEFLEIFEIKPFIKKLIVYFQLRSIENEIEEQLKEKSFINNPHQSWEARLKVILIDDLFKQELRDTVIRWKNEVDEKLKNENINWQVELLTLKNIVKGIKDGINPLIPFLISILTLGLITFLLILFGKYFSLNISFGK